MLHPDDLVVPIYFLNFRLIVCIILIPPHDLFQQDVSPDFFDVEIRQDCVAGRAICNRENVGFTAILAKLFVVLVREKLGELVRVP